MELSKEQIEDAIKMATTPDLPNFSKAGTGKTHTTLEAIRRVDEGLPHLILCPRIALRWWEQQAREFLGADARIMKTGNSPLKGDIIITTYGLARNARHRLYEHFDGGSLTLDESDNLANPDAKQTQAVFGNHADLRGGLAERFDTVWPLTGTPIRSFADDMYTQVATLHPDTFEQYGIRTYDDFCAKFTYKKQKQFNPRMRPVWKVVASSNEGMLHRIVYEEIGAIRRLEAPGLPQLRFRTLEVAVKLTKEVRDACRGMTPEQIVAQFNDENSIIAKVWRLVGLAKVEEIVPYVGDCVRSSPILLGCWHHDVMNAYAEHFDKMGLRYEIVSGKTPNNMLEPIRERFNNGDLDVIIGQMRAMGSSWNLQEASNHVIIGETYPAPSVIEQFYKRVYRRGQKAACDVDLIVGDNDIDHALEAVRLRKEKSDEKVNG